jgi:hypothetical protein
MSVGLAPGIRLFLQRQPRRGRIAVAILPSRFVLSRNLDSPSTDTAVLEASIKAPAIIGEAWPSRRSFRPTTLKRWRAHAIGVEPFSIKPRRHRIRQECKGDNMLTASISAPKSDLNELKVEAFTAKRVRNEHPGGKMTWQNFHVVRNAVVRACRKFGTTGPMGEIKLDPQVKDLNVHLADDPSFWLHGDEDPKYHVADDAIGNERFVRITLHGDNAIDAGWLAAVVATLREHRGWAVEIGNIPQSTLLIFGKRILVKGRQLGRCKTAAQVVEVAARLLKQGPKRWWQFWR